MYLWRKDSGFFFQMRIPARQAVNLGATPLRIWLGALPKREAQRRATALAVVAGEGFNSGMDKETLTRSLKSLAEELASSRRAEFSAGLGVLGARSAANEEQAYGESADPELVSHFRQREARASGRKEAIITARRRLETIGQALEIDAAAWTAERETYRDILSMGVRVPAPASMPDGAGAVPSPTTVESKSDIERDEREITADTLLSVAARIHLDTRKAAKADGSDKADRYQERLETSVAAFIDVVGDKPLRNYLPIHMQDFATVLGRVPINRSKYRFFDGLSLREIADIDGRLIFSPSDLVTYFQSPFASWMERARLDDPSLNELIDPEDPLLASLAKQGYAHEVAFNQTLAKDGLPLRELARADPATMYAATVEAMREGCPAIAQGYLRHGEFGGLADLLIRVEGHSDLGEWHYEIWDTKLSRSVKPYFAIQLCAYADMLEAVQGRRPETVAIVLGTSERVPLRVSDYFFYYCKLKRSFLADQSAFDLRRMPDPAARSDFGRWSNYAERLLKERDHPSLVANITKGQIKHLAKAGITSVAGLASSELDRVARIGDPVFRRLKRQAALQLVSQGQERPEYELAEHADDETVGLKLLPPPSKNDIFFDIEGFPLIEGGLEYLWGATFYATNGEREFIDFWAHNRDQEREAFANFVDWAYARWSADPTMHIYHYAAYEVSAVRRLMGRYGTREHEVDQLLRNNVFVDLYQIVRQALVVGEPRYSIKNIEHLYRPKRETEVTSGGDSVVVYEAWRENPDGCDWRSSKVLRDIRDYNRDDCDSTEELTRWLRERQRIAGISYALPTDPKEPPKKEEREGVAAFRDHLLRLAEQERGGNPDRASMIETIAFSLEFHQRENKPMWWRFFDRQGMSEAELCDDMDCISGLERTETAPIDPGGKRNTKLCFEYRFDADQDFKGNASEYRILEPQARKVAIHELDEKSGRLMIKAEFEPPRKLSLIPFEFVNPKPIPDAIARVAQNLLESDFGPCAISDFLLRRRPRIRNNAEGPIIRGDADLICEITEAVRNLENSCLCIQGPPGAGKTYTASHVIAALLLEGKKVGISSNSHKAINNLFEGVLERVGSQNTNPVFIKIDRDGDRDPALYDRSELNLVASASEAIRLLDEGPAVIGGTAWAFAHESLIDALDYLFVDEAGQVAIANLLGMSSSTRNIV